MSMNAFDPDFFAEIFFLTVPVYTTYTLIQKPPPFPNGSAKINIFIFYIQAFF